ncbi:hypothetical protein TcCL_Unassigned03704, partial [Trypanosoma cruzi]
VTCGRATRACGAEHTFLPSCLVFFAARAGRHPQRHTRSHTLPLSKGIFCALRVYFTRRHFFRGRSCEHFFPPMLRFFLLRSLSRWSDATAVMSACFSQSPHTRVTVRCGPPSRADERAEGSSNAQMTP